MIWFMLEGAIALALLIFIVWWTMPRKERAVTPPAPQPEREDVPGDSRSTDN
jgi:hypothetical protein